MEEGDKKSGNTMRDDMQQRSLLDVTVSRCVLDHYFSKIPPFLSSKQKKTINSGLYGSSWYCGNRDPTPESDQVQIIYNNTNRVR